jgi:hypothetical protein
LMDVAAETSKDVAAVNIKGRRGGKHRRTSRRQTSKDVAAENIEGGVAADNGTGAAASGNGEGGRKSSIQ